VAGVGKEGRKVFFSEEKKQKTFNSPPLPAYRPWPDRLRQRRIKSLLVLFFRKEQSCLPFLFSHRTGSLVADSGVRERGVMPRLPSQL
jgi:hypothetical protein